MSPEPQHSRVEQAAPAADDVARADVMARMFREHNDRAVTLGDGSEVALGGSTAVEEGGRYLLTDGRPR